MTDPLISVVVSTYNRPARLAALLASLREQTLDRQSYEVVVVDNGSEAPTGEVLSGERARGDLDLRTVRHERTLGPAGGRNSGWRAARGALIAFTDDDCTADADWLSRGLDAAEASPGAIVQGRTEPDPARRGSQSLVTHTVRIERIGPQYETCNIFYPRALLESLDGFDERFGLRPAGEDTDLAWRAIAGGAATVFAPEALVFHAVERIGPRGMLALAARWGPSTRLFAEHPGTRAMLYRGLFWNVWHYLFWRSLLSLAGPRWLSRMLIRMHLRQLRRRALRAGAGAWAIPYLILFDAVECAAIARGAIRNRTFVL